MNRIPEPQQLPISFGPFALLELLKRGGMAEVYRAKRFGAEGFEKQLAIKRIRPDVAHDESFVTMFIDEAKIMAHLTHPNIARIDELGYIGNSYGIVMEYIAGCDLKQICMTARERSEPLGIINICFLMSEICDALGYAHKKKSRSGKPLNIVHRDVSPQNILVSYEGDVKLIDFGIAKTTEQQTETQAGVLKGKYSYMSPEQVTGLPVDARSDIFSLGIVMHEMLTLHRLFRGPSDFETLQKILRADVEPPSAINSEVPPELDQIVLKALTANRDHRYQTATDFAKALHDFLRTQGHYASRHDISEYMCRVFTNEREQELEKQRHFSQLSIPTSTGWAAEGPYKRVSTFTGESAPSFSSPSISSSNTPSTSSDPDESTPPTGNYHFKITSTYEQTSETHHQERTPSPLIPQEEVSSSSTGNPASTGQRTSQGPLLKIITIGVIITLLGLVSWGAVKLLIIPTIEETKEADEIQILRLNTEPSGASVQLLGDNKYYVSPCVIEITTESENPTILVKKLGFKDIKEPIKLQGKETNKTLQLTPITIQLTFSSEQPNTSIVLLDDQGKSLGEGNTPITFDEVKPALLESISITYPEKEPFETPFIWNEKSEQTIEVSPMLKNKRQRPTNWVNPDVPLPTRPATKEIKEAQ